MTRIKHPQDRLQRIRISEKKKRKYSQPKASRKKFIEECLKAEEAEDELREEVY